MTEAEREKYRKLLEEEKERLIRELQKRGYELELKHDWVVRIEEGEEEHTDPLDEAQLTEDLENKIAEFSVIEKEYRAVEDALKRLEQGTYGICVICGKEIEKERLEAYPAANTCEEHRNVLTNNN